MDFELRRVSKVSVLGCMQEVRDAKVFFYDELAYLSQILDSAIPSSALKNNAVPATTASTCERARGSGRRRRREEAGGGGRREEEDEAGEGDEDEEAQDEWIALQQPSPPHLISNSSL